MIHIVGAGGHAKVIVGLCRHQKLPVAGCVDDDPARAATSVLGVPVRGTLSSLPHNAQAVLGIGKNEVRYKLAERLKCSWKTLVHKTAFVDDSVVLGAGTVVFAGAVIQPDVKVGVHAIINTMVSIDHDCLIGDFAHIAPGCHLAGDVTIGAGAFLGVGVSVIPGVKIGNWAVVGAGAVVVRDVPDGVTVTGVPAREAATGSPKSPGAH
jgi:sugar O-acyltransferase (sialic acid O-acetyltransferase NeuD family)